MSYDLLIFQGEEGQLDQSLENAEDVSFYITGIRKAAQAWLILFLNGIGSSRYRPTHGSTLIPYIRSGRVNNEQILRSLFFQADLEARLRMKVQQRANAPASERLTSSNLLAISVFEDQAVLKVQLNNELGDNRTIDVPVTVLT